MSDFLEFYAHLTKRFPLHLEIYQSRIMDWCIEITKKGCAEETGQGKNKPATSAAAILRAVTDIITKISGGAAIAA